MEQLGKAGLVSVEEDTNMQNPERMEKFYADYLNGQDSMVTIFEVQRDGLIGAVTFIYRKEKIQTYYIGVRWMEGGMPEIQGTSVSDVTEIKLTEKGYFIYAYEYVIAHASLRQYWRIKPLSEECRELGKRYLEGLDYQMYNLLVINWNSNNSYIYEQIYASPYPPFGEVVDYTENIDGTITLIVDGVWPDYNSDLAFRNTVVVQPFEDGTFRYLSNSIEQIELELPPIARTKG